MRFRLSGKPSFTKVIDKQTDGQTNDGHLSVCTVQLSNKKSHFSSPLFNVDVIFVQNDRIFISQTDLDCLTDRKIYKQLFRSLKSQYWQSLYIVDVTFVPKDGLSVFQVNLTNRSISLENVFSDSVVVRYSLHNAVAICK